MTEARVFIKKGGINDDFGTLYVDNFGSLQTPRFASVDGTKATATCNAASSKTPLDVTALNRAATPSANPKTLPQAAIDEAAQQLHETGTVVGDLNAATHTKVYTKSPMKQMCARIVQ